MRKRFGVLLIFLAAAHVRGDANFAQQLYEQDVDFRSKHSGKRAKKTLQNAAQPVAEDYTHFIPRIKGEVVMVCPEGFTLLGNQCVAHTKAAKMETCPYGSYRNKKGQCMNIDSTRPEKVCGAGFEWYYKGCIRRYQLPTKVKCPYGYEQNDQKLCVTSKLIPATMQCPPGFYNSQSYDADSHSNTGVGHELHHLRVGETVLGGETISPNLCYHHKSVEPQWRCPGGGYVPSTDEPEKRLCEREVPVKAVAVCPEGTVPEVARRKLAGDHNEGPVVNCMSQKEIPGQLRCPMGFSITTFNGQGVCVREFLIPNDPWSKHDDEGTLMSCETGYRLVGSECHLELVADPVAPGVCPHGYISKSDGHSAKCVREEVQSATRVCGGHLGYGIGDMDTKVMMIEGVNQKVSVTCQGASLREEGNMVNIVVQVEPTMEFVDEGRKLNPDKDCQSISETPGVVERFIEDGDHDELNNLARRLQGISHMKAEVFCVRSTRTLPILSCPKTTLDEDGEVITGDSEDDDDESQDSSSFSSSDDEEKKTKKGLQNLSRGGRRQTRSMLGIIDAVELTEIPSFEDAHASLNCVSKQSAPQIPFCTHNFDLVNAKMVTDEAIGAKEDVNLMKHTKQSWTCVSTETTEATMMCPTGTNQHIISTRTGLPHAHHRVLEGVQEAHDLFPDEVTGLCTALMVAEPESICPAGYKHGTYDKDYGTYLSKDLCERIEFAEHQEVCPHGYERKKHNDKKKACVAEKEVPPSLICPPGYWMKDGGTHTFNDDGFVHAPRALGVETECVKSVTVSPSLVSHDGEHSACRPGLDGAPSCELEMRHYAEISPEKYNKGKKIHREFS
eukprot:GHVN01050657.1.p1 GENE.GHVN01050657.1~~GHVN01050657.1.p1  ORF type:complete len:842 (+),score=121.81 GHVN01050657.1:18-2543(+)